MNQNASLPQASQVLTLFVQQQRRCEMAEDAGAMAMRYMGSTKRSLKTWIAEGTTKE